MQILRQRRQIQNQIQIQGWAPPGFSFAGDRLIRLGKLNDPEYVRQRKIFDDQFEDSEGFDVDWDSFDYKFFAMKLEWAGDLDENLNNTELRTLLIETAIKEHNDEYAS
ncbi:hypothetical protein V5N11_003264 [Cardamine amara subsp. amara]|uniref:Uncharacterized protein n=1 Tax=Cardamine amara subsp. amara TaxID=228776 RepID=A0ABD1BTR8_CARAN